MQEDSRGEARLLIGDEALQEWLRTRGKGFLDLGKAWTDWTQKPFVYAVWAVGPKTRISQKDLDRFRDACREGIATREELAKDEEERSYLMQCIRYGLGKEEKIGLEEFAARSGLSGVQVEWV